MAEKVKISQKDFDEIYEIEKDDVPVDSPLEGKEELKEGTYEYVIKKYEDKEEEEFDNVND